MSKKALNRRDFLKAAGIATAAGILAACVPSTPTANKAAEATKAPAETVPPKQPVSLKGIAWGGVQHEGDLYKQFAKTYTDTHPGITVTFETIAEGYGEKLLTAFAAGDPPDYFYAGAPDIPTYVQKGMIVPIDEKVAVEPAIISDLVSPNCVIKLAGKTYSWLNAAFPYVLYYNKKMFKEAGLDEPTDKWVWDDMAIAAQKLTKKDGNKVVQYGFQCDEYVRFFLNHFWTNGGKLFDNEDKPTKATFNDSIGLAAVNYMRSFVQAFGAAPAPGLKGALGYREAFINQKVAMTLDGMWMISQFSAKSDLEYGIGMIPRGKGEYLTWSGADTWLAAATGKNRDLAFDVIKTSYNSPTAQLIFADYGGPQAIGIPVYKSALNDPKWKPSAILQVPSKQAPFGRPDPIFLNSGSWEWDLLQNKLQEILLTNEDPQKVLDDAAAKTVSDYLSKIG